MNGRLLALLSILLTFLFTVQADTKVYTWVDKNGKTNFSDKARPGTSTVTVTTTNLFSKNKVPEKQKQDAVNKAEAKNHLKKSDKSPILYDISITSPENDLTLRSNDGLVVIKVSSTPALTAAHKLQLFIDGKAQGEPQSTSSIRAKNMDRGTHKLQVKLIDKKEAIAAETQIITIHLLRATIKQPRPAIVPQ